MVSNLFSTWFVANCNSKMAVTGRLGRLRALFLLVLGVYFAGIFCLEFSPASFLPRISSALRRHAPASSGSAPTTRSRLLVKAGGTDLADEASRTEVVVNGSVSSELSDVSEDWRKPAGSSTSLCPECRSERRNFVFIKCMKCATESLVSSFRNFGNNRNLSFALPLASNLWLSWPDPVREVDIRPSLTGRYNILCDHAVYTPDLMARLMPNDTVYISAVREPFSRFKSTLRYFGLLSFAEADYPEDPLGHYLRNLQHFEPLKSRLLRGCPARNFSLIRNLMSHCLGMPLGWPAGREDISGDAEKVRKYIEQVDSRFLLVLVVEHLHESLVLLKRALCWSTKDVLYRKLNVADYAYKADRRQDLVNIYRNISHVDYLLYDHLNETLWRKIRQEGNDFWGEVAEFTRTQNRTAEFCDSVKKKKKNSERMSLRFNRTRWDKGFFFMDEDCNSVYMLPTLRARYENSVSRSVLAEYERRLNVSRFRC